MILTLAKILLPFTLGTLAMVSTGACGSSNEGTGGSGSGVTSTGKGASNSSSGTGSQGAGGAGPATLHLLNMVRGIDAAALCIGGKEVEPQVPFLSAGKRQGVPLGAVTVSVAAVGSACAQPLASDISVTSDETANDWSILYMGAQGSTAAPPTLKAIPIIDKGPFATYAGLQFIDAATLAAPYDLVTGMGSAAQPTFFNAPYGTVASTEGGARTYIFEAPTANSYSLRHSGTLSDVLTSAVVTPEPGAVYSFVAVFEKDVSPTSLLFCEDFPSPQCSAISP